MTALHARSVVVRLCAATVFGIASTLVSCWFLAAASRFPEMSTDEVMQEAWHADVVRLEHTTAEVFVQRGPGIARYSAHTSAFFSLNRGTTSERVPRQVVAHLQESLKGVRPPTPPPAPSTTAPAGTFVCHPVGPMTSYVYEAAGWPMGAMMHTVTTTDSHVRAAKWGLAVLLPDELDAASGRRFQSTVEDRLAALPLCPLWPGFVVDTVLYGGAGWGVLALVFAARRSARRRRGLCAECAYDRSGVDSAAPCPECGRSHAPRTSGVDALGVLARS